MTDQITIPRALLEQAMNMIPTATEKNIALKRALRAELAKPSTAHAQHDAPETLALKAERDAAMKDAERYRWLRDATPWTAISAFDKTRVAFRLASKFSEEAQDTGVDLDKAIDAAIAKAEGRTE